MNFRRALELLFKGKKMRVKGFLPTDHYFIKNNKLYFTGEGWGKPKIAYFTKEDFEDKEWEILKEKTGENK